MAAKSEGSVADRFPPQVLREYALLADGERGALIGPKGDVAWLCAPRWDSDAVFSSLVGGTGVYAVTPVEPFVWGGYYENGSLIWRSRWTTTDSIIECREALSFPGDTSRMVLLRRIVAVDGDAHVEVVLDARAGFGKHRMEDLHKAPARGSTIWTGRSGRLQLRWSGAGTARHRAGKELAMSLAIPEGGQHDLVLEISEGALPDVPADASTCWEATEQTWQKAVPDLADCLAPKDTRHAYAVLRGMTSAAGGMVAAASMSLPERAEQGRNYDYRYVWIRDQSFTGQAIAAAGAHPLLDDAVRFVSGRMLEHGPGLAPAYTVTGDPVPDEHTLSLPGYPGGYDVAGNHVNSQFQLDAFGEALMLFAAAARHDHLDADGWRAIEVAADAIEKRWDKPEAGIWELDDRRWTESRLICVAGLRAVSAAVSSGSRTRSWLTLAERILAETAATSTHPSGRWQRAPDDESLDAALLLPPLRGAPPADDPRTLATLQGCLDDLCRDHYMYRFRQQPGALAEAEGAFLLCGFVMAMAQHQQGNQVEAVRWFERNRSACGPPGLFSEEYDVNQRQLRGNLPQAFVHALMLEASVRLAEHPQLDR
ncbi:MAG TPA: glycoside hydrolase family 15 protein [Nocardioidaceae bacterium]|nr:glycoside hydrolase family 15 protein [Nocardioidaceae bacterium]